jgi:hypothetical protein
MAVPRPFDVSWRPALATDSPWRAPVQDPAQAQAAPSQIVNHARRSWPRVLSYSFLSYPQ